MNELNHRHSVKLTNLTCTKQLNVAIKYFGDTALWEPMACAQPSLNETAKLL